MGTSSTIDTTFESNITDWQVFFNSKAGKSVTIGENIDVPLGTTLTIPSTVDLAAFVDGAMFTGHGTIIIGRMSARPTQQIFETTLSVTLPCTSSPLWFGAAADGVTDDFEALQAAFDAGYHVYIPTGDYVVGYTIRVRKNGQNIYGDGYDTHLIAKPNTKLTTLLLLQSSIVDTQLRGVSVHDLRLDGNRNNQAGSPVEWEMKLLRIVCENVDMPCDHDIYNVWAHDAYSYYIHNSINSTEGGGISIEDVDHDVTVVKDYYRQNINIHDCYCYENEGWGIGTNWGRHITIQNNHCYLNKTMGVTIWNSQDVIVNGNQCYRNSSQNLNVEVSERVRFTDNNTYSICETIEGRPFGGSSVKIYNSEDIQVEGNTIQFDQGDSSSSNRSALTIQSTPTAYGPNFKTRVNRKILVHSNTILCTGVGPNGTAHPYAVYLPISSITTPSQQYDNDIWIDDNTIDCERANSIVFITGGNITFSGNRCNGNISIISNGTRVDVSDNEFDLETTTAIPTAQNIVTITSPTQYYVQRNRFTVSVGMTSAVVLATSLTITGWRGGVVSNNLCHIASGTQTSFFSQTSGTTSVRNPLIFGNQLVGVFIDAYGNLAYSGSPNGEYYQGSTSFVADPLTGYPLFYAYGAIGPKSLHVGQPVTDEGGGLVGLPVDTALVGHDFAPGTLVTITGTTNYNGTYTVNILSTQTKIVIEESYVAEVIAIGSFASGYGWNKSAQVGLRECNGNPNSVMTPVFVGEIVLDITSSYYWQAINRYINGWRKILTENSSGDVSVLRNIQCVGVNISEGTNSRQGVVTLSNGQATVNTTAVASNSRIQLTIQSLGTVTEPKAIGVTARTPGTSFTISSADNTDTSVVAWVLFNPA